MMADTLVREEPIRTHPRVPPGRRVYAIGDIHGRHDLLARLHQRILDDAAKAAASEHAPDNVVVYLGDYVDRGPGAREVIEMLIEAPLPGFGRVLLKGNHEDMMLGFLAGPANPLWLFNGGVATASSYGALDLPTMPNDRELEHLRQRLLACLPDRHLEFLTALKTLHVEGDYLFVHAGVRPGTALGDQQERDLMWIRGPFLSAEKDFGKRVVHGHTITTVPDVALNRIGIDTGAYYTGRLTCLVLEDDTLRFLQT
jgi:serine/threonine protein phosphatase 1